MEAFQFNEEYLSQIPALQLLINLGYVYLPPEETTAARGGRLGNILLEEVLREQLKKINRIQYKGGSYLFSEENIQSAIQRLKTVRYEGLQKTNETVYDLLTLGVSLEQSIEGDLKSFTLNYIDWKNPANNAFHVTSEFAVEKSRSHETARPDIVLFVNGIPFAVLECKSPKTEVQQAVSQMVRNQQDDYIPRLFAYVQMVMGSNKNDALYATIGTPAKLWARWQEHSDTEEEVAAAVNKKLSPAQKDQLFSGSFASTRPYFEELETQKRALTAQDKAIYSLFRPQRLMALVYQYTVFDSGTRKVARYQQYFAIQKIVARVQEKDPEGRRRGGIIWHTQGSGKSLTMVMLARALAIEAKIRTPRIVLVTDRVDLDKQLGNTFAACGLSPERAESGKHLLELVTSPKAHIVTTLVHKFDKAMNVKKYQDESADIFMLVDESHRTNFGSFAARMRQMFPRACYIGFTGTPLLKKEKNSFAKFGGLIDAYAIDQAVKDGAVVPLLYEGRHVEMLQNEKAIDLWFERHTQGLTEAQKADLKRKYSRAEMLNKTEQVIYMRAFDISEHYRQTWQGTGFKGQLVAPGKGAAIQYKRFLDEIGHVTSEVIISAPDQREGFDETEETESSNEVVAFWQKMMKRFGGEEEYLKQIINQFKNGDEPEILIVVDKLLTGFDAPRNAVMYLTRKLKEHSLLQAIARVNRLYEDGGTPKDFGFIIDYAGVLGELDKALTTYSALEGFEEDDLRGCLVSINEEVKKLPQHHADLLDLFKEIKNHRDEEDYERLLADEKVRNQFYERLAQYAKTLGIALSSEQFIMGTPEPRMQRYKNDLKRFQNLKAAVKLRYSEAISYRDYEAKIQKLLDTHITAHEVQQLIAPVNIFDEEAFKQVVAEKAPLYQSTAAQADLIAHAAKRAISERLEQDPAFYSKFSRLIQQAIDEWRAQRISDLEYLKRVKEIQDALIHRKMEEVPARLRNNDDAIAFFGILQPYLKTAEKQDSSISAQAALDILAIIQRNRKVHYWDDQDAQKKTIDEIDDYLYDHLKLALNMPLSTAEMDEIIEKCMKLAQHRFSS